MDGIPMRAYDRRLRIRDCYQAEPGYSDAFVPLFFELRTLLSWVRHQLWRILSVPYLFFVEEARKPPDIDILVSTIAIILATIWFTYAFARSCWRFFLYKIGLLKLPPSGEAADDAAPDPSCGCNSRKSRSTVHGVDTQRRPI